MTTRAGKPYIHRSAVRSLLILTGLVCAGVLSALSVTPAVATAEPSVLSQFCSGGTAPSQCNIPWGVATNGTTGDIYVADQSNHRIQQFTAWGEFIRLWGLRGSGPGEFELPRGVAVDSSGDVYVVDSGNWRVQKFDSEGHFLLMFGGEVDKTTHANVCTKADIEGGDTCGAGVQGTAPGFFNVDPGGSSIAVGPANKVYVGDEERIEAFDPSGAFVESIALPESGRTVQSLAIDNNPISPSLYVSYVGANPTNAKPNVQKLSPTGSLLGTLNVQNPMALATDASNGDVYVLNRQQIGASVLRFNSSGTVLESLPAEEFFESVGLATNAPETCGLEGSDLIVSNSEGGHSFVRIYGPPPNSTICPPPESAPSIDDQFATAVDASSATVKAKINPEFWTESTRYFVEYGTGKCSEGGCTTKQPTPPGALLGGPVTNQDLTTSGVSLVGLSSDTTYHFRFVAKSNGAPTSTTGAEESFHTLPSPSEPGADSCPNATFRTGAAAHLPDCRAYEMVSPVDKNGADIFTNTNGYYNQEKSELAVADEAGERMTFSSLSAFGGAEGASFSNQYLATRESTGWSAKAITAPRSPISFYVNGSSATLTNYKLFSENLCSGWLLQDSPVALVPGAPDETGTLYRRDLCGGGFEVSSSVKPPHFSFEAVNSRYFPEVQGASANGASTVFRADDELIKGGSCKTAGIFQVYETVGGGRLRLVSVLPGKASSAGLPSCEQSSAGTAQGRPGDARSDSTVGAVSEDGERIYWTTGGEKPDSEGGGSGDQPGTIYLRDNAREEESKHSKGECTEATKACSYKVSGLVSAERARFLAGAEDGSRAFFALHAGEKEELYEYEAPGEKDPLGAVTLIAKGFQGFMGASKNAQRAYFVSSEPDPGWEGTSGKENLYFHEKGVAAPTLVGELSAKDVLGNTVLASEVPSPVSPVPSQRTSRVSPDGLSAAFLSTAELTHFNNTDLESGEADAEAFLYSAAPGGGKGKLVCASCNASGVRPTGRQVVSVPSGEFKLWAAAIIPGWPAQTRGGRALSNNGKRLFFTSFEPLVLRDTNDRADVYEWQAVSSKEECLKQPASGGKGGELFLSESSGCISLISSGQSPQDSEFLDATPEGTDVFFATASSLVPQDPGQIDVYDARVDGGFAPPAAPKASCEGEACQSPSPAAQVQAPSSAGYAGPGNLRQPKAKPCSKGKVKKKGRCVKKASKHHKKANHKKKSKADESGRKGR